MSRWEKIAFIRINLEGKKGIELDRYSDDELDALIREIINAMHCRDLGIQKMKNILIFLN